MISGRSSETTYEQTEKWKPLKTSSVTAAPPTTMAALEHQHAPPRASEVGRRGEPVVPGADDDDVVSHTVKIVSGRSWLISTNMPTTASSTVSAVERGAGFFRYAWRHATRRRP